MTTTISKLSRAQSQMTIGTPTEEDVHHQHHMKVENLNHATLIKPEELQLLIQKLTIDNNEQILHILEEAKTPYLFTSDDLSKLIEVTTSVKTKIAIIGMVGPRLVDPKSKTTYFTGLFRYAEEKSAVEEILKARTQTLASAMFSKTDGIKNMSGRHLLGRGSPGRGGGGGRGTGNNSRASSNTSLASGSRDKAHSPHHAAIASLLSDDHHDTLTPTQSGFDDVLSALDDLSHKNNNSRRHHATNKDNLGMIAIEEDAGRTTNDSSSVDSNDNMSPRQTKAKSKSVDDGKVTLNKVDSCNTVVVEAPGITIEERSSTTAKTSNDDDVSSISSQSIESNTNRSVTRPRSLNKRSATTTAYLVNLNSPPSSAEKKTVATDATFQNIKTITKKYSEAAIRTSRDENEVTHEAITVTSTVADRTKAIANPLLNKKPASASAATATPPAQSAVGKVKSLYQPQKQTSSPASTVKTESPKVGKLSLQIYPFAQPKPAAAPATTTTTQLVTPAPVRHSARITTTKVTYMSSSRSLASHSSDNDSIGSHGSLRSAKSVNSPPVVRSGTPRLSEPAPGSLPALPVLSNYNPEKAQAGGSGNFNYDLATRCAMAVQMTKEEFLELPEKEPIRVVDGIEKHSYCELVRRNFVKTYGNLQQSDLEKYLVEEEFPLAFQKTAEQFFAQVRWRQVEQKKKALLF